MHRFYYPDDFNTYKGDCRIIGFSEVTNNPDKVQIWFQQVIERPDYLDPFKLARRLNGTERMCDWAKMISYKSKVVEMLSGQGDFNDEETLDFKKQWDFFITNAGEMKKFKLLIMNNPIDNVTKIPLNIEIKHTTTIPESVYSRAKLECGDNPFLYKELVEKYKKRSILKTYGTITELGEGDSIRGLVDAYIIKDNIRYAIYEEKYIVNREVNHKWADYRSPMEEDKLKNELLNGEPSKPETGSSTNIRYDESCIEIGSDRIDTQSIPKEDTVIKI